MGVVNTMSLYLHHESLPILWVYTISPCLNNGSMSIPWVDVYTRSLILYHHSMSIPWVFVKSMLPFLCIEKYSYQIYRNTNNKNKEMQSSELQKYNMQFYRNPKLGFPSSVLRPSSVCHVRTTPPKIWNGIDWRALVESHPPNIGKLRG